MIKLQNNFITSEYSRNNDAADEWYNPTRQNSQFDIFINPNE